MSTNPFDDDDDSDVSPSTNPFADSYKEEEETSKSSTQSGSSSPPAKSSLNPFEADFAEDDASSPPLVTSSKSTEETETETEDSSLSHAAQHTQTHNKPPAPPDRSETPEAVRMRRAVSEALRGEISPSPSRHSTASSITSRSPTGQGADLIFDGTRGSSFSHNPYQNPRFASSSPSHSAASVSDALAQAPLPIPYPEISFSTPPMFKSLIDYIHGDEDAELDILDSDISELEHTLSLVDAHVQELKDAHDLCMDACLDQERKFHQSLSKKKEEVRSMPVLRRAGEIDFFPSNLRRYYYDNCSSKTSRRKSWPSNTATRQASPDAGAGGESSGNG